MTVIEEAKKYLTDMAAHQNCCGVPVVRKLVGEIERLRGAITTTLEQNGHLTDGDNCTLANLKRAIAAQP